MSSTFLLINGLLLVISTILNILHLVTVFKSKQKLDAVTLSRIVSPSCLVLISTIMYPVDSYINNNLEHRTMINKFQDSEEVFLIASYLGVNLVEAITKFRAYNIIGQSSALMTKKSVWIPECLVALVAAIGSFSVFACDFFNSSTTSLSGISPASFAFELTFYHVCGILPVLSIYLIITIQAFRYVQKTTPNATTPLDSIISSQRKQLVSVTQYVLTYFVAFICGWSPFLVFKILCFTSKNLSRMQLYKSLILSSKLVMFALNPIASGMLQKRDRQLTMSIISKAFHTLNDKLFTSSSSPSSSDTHASNGTRSFRMKTYTHTETVLLQTNRPGCQTEDDGKAEDSCNMSLVSCVDDKKLFSPGNYRPDSPPVHSEETQRLCVRRLKFALPDLQIVSFDSTSNNISASANCTSSDTSPFPF